jgi:hypothetical protein
MTNGFADIKAFGTTGKRVDVDNDVHGVEVVRAEKENIRRLVNRREGILMDANAIKGRAGVDSFGLSR